MTRVFDENLALVEPQLKEIVEALGCHAKKVSGICGKDISCKYELGKVKENEFLVIARSLNPLGIGVVPYEYKHNNKRYSNESFKGFTDPLTKNIIYINVDISIYLIQVTALHELIHIAKYLNPVAYASILETLKNDNDYILFYNSPVNKDALKNSIYVEDEYDDESFANFFTINANNEEIPFHFFRKLNNNRHTVTFSKDKSEQLKYYNMMMDLVNLLKKTI